MGQLSDRDVLYNAVLRTVKEQGTGMEIGLVQAVLEDVNYSIHSATNCCNFDTVSEKLKERKPRTCK